MSSKALDPYITIRDSYNEKGFAYCKAFFNETELAGIRQIILHFHAQWRKTHAKLYESKAVNSAYLTRYGVLTESDRLHLFQFLASNKLISVVTSVFGSQPVFMNTQLFFDPLNAGQKNYWHRDPQYHLSIDEQKLALVGPQVIHFRIPLFDEPGIELIPETHKRWDTAQEQAVRLEEGDHRNYENLESGVEIPLFTGDLLVFSANMIHRGLYGKDRLALDILFCERDKGVFEFIDLSCLPDAKMLNGLQNSAYFSL